MRSPLSGQTCLGAAAFPPSTTIDQMIEQAAAAGFDGLELLVEPAAELSFDTAADTCRRWARQATDANLRIVSLECKLTAECDLGCDSREARRRARDRVAAALERAANMGAGGVSVAPAVVGEAPVGSRPSVPVTDYDEALARVYEMLCALAPEAERLGAVIGVVPAAGRFLLSPAETRQLIDRVNSPFVGTVLDLAIISAVGYPQQWITTLGRRTAAMRISDCDAGTGRPCPPGAGVLDLTAIERAIAEAYYRGPLIFTGPGSLAEVLAGARRMVGQPARKMKDER